LNEDSDITLKRGITGSTNFRPGSNRVLQRLSAEVGRTVFDAKGTDVAIETLSLCCERLERD
jgi:hypothetical protein